MRNWSGVEGKIIASALDAQALGEQSTALGSANWVQQKVVGSEAQGCRKLRVQGR